MSHSTTVQLYQLTVASYSLFKGLGSYLQAGRVFYLKNLHCPPKTKRQMLQYQRDRLYFMLGEFAYSAISQGMRTLPAVAAMFFIDSLLQPLVPLYTESIIAGTATGLLAAFLMRNAPVHNSYPLLIRSSKNAHPTNPSWLWP